MVWKDTMDCNLVSEHARSIRHNIIAMIHEAGSGHPGGSLSCADIMASLYFGGVLNYDAQNPTDAARDRFIMSKGHAAPALYATLAEAGFIEKSELATLRKLGTRLQGHPDSNLVPGVEVSTGSLGQGLSISAGLAAGLKLEQNPAFVFTLLGDGECEEGQVWEAATFAAFNNLDNLVAIVDENGLQIDGPVHEVCEVTSLAEKFAAFGWKVFEIDGHDISAIINTLTTIKETPAGVPSAVIAKTIKGRGVSFMENQAGWHGKAPNDEQTKQALAEIDEEVCGAE